MSEGARAWAALLVFLPSESLPQELCSFYDTTSSICDQHVDVNLPETFNFIFI